MSVLREGGMVRHITIQPKATKPSIGQIKVDFLAQATLGTDAEAVTYDQHSDHQLRIDRWPAYSTVEWSQLSPQIAQLHKPIDRTQQVIGRNMPFQRELVEQSSLIDLPMSHHDSALSQRLNQRTSCVAITEFFNTIGQKQTCAPDNTLTPGCGPARLRLGALHQIEMMR